LEMRTSPTKSSARNSKIN